MQLHYCLQQKPLTHLFSFIFWLLNLFFKDIMLLTPFILFFIVFWSFFIKNNFYSVRINPSSSDILKNSKFLKKVHYVFFINWLTSNSVILCMYIFFIKLDFNAFWFNHLKINNFNLNIIILVIFLSLFSFFLVKFIKNSNVNYNIDYFSALSNLIIFVPFIFLTNTIYTFLFFLELISLIILYKFSVSRIWFNHKSFNRILPKSYLNMIFFQYWANFFSSMFIMFSVFNVIYIYGSSEWFFLNLLNVNQKNFYYLNSSILHVYIWLSFFIGVFLKIGFTPFHLFKIEVYKGIPFISIFFYTTWYFLSFFLYFCIIVFNNINLLTNFFNIIFFVFIFLGVFYCISLLFDVNLIKSFFAYSTIVNVVNFIIVLYVAV